MNKKLDIRPLLFRVSEGDQDAFKVLFNAYCHRVNSFATRLTRSESIGQESVQDVFMKIWLKRESLKSVENFDAFIFTIVRNHVYNMLRRQALEAQVRTTFYRELREAPQSEEDDGFSERKQLLRRVIDALPRQQRRVFHLCQLQGLKYQEAATLLNISRLTVKTHMQQALRTIRLQLGRLILAVIGGIFSQLL
ncbi:MAG TPA: RNA polymerase sigma-70 factor [Chryseolinea sp.]|nr:RNA polymerase sigma-70 factor [Chryseolinea sp.]